MALETTILVKERTRNELKHLGHKGQTYNDIIEQLLEQSKLVNSNLKNSSLGPNQPSPGNQTAVPIIGVS